MKFPRSTNLLKLAWLASFSLPTAHAQSTGGSNLPTQLITYQLTEIIADPTSAITLPIALSTSLIGNSPTPGDPVASPQDTDIQWSGSTGEPLFTPSSGGSSVKLDFTQPFVKTLSDAATTITATYTFGSGPSSGSGSDPSLPPPTVYPSSQTKNLDRIYLDFWVANTEDATDDVVLVRTTDSELASGEKTVLHWAKVTVKHSRGQSLKLKIENATSSGKPLYFLDQEENPNTQTQDPQLSNKLEKEFDDGKFFWVGSAEKGAGVSKFKAQGDLGSGYKDAPEEKTVSLLPVDLDIEYGSQTGVLDDSKEDVADGGYISLKSQTHQGEDITPTTYLVIRPTAGLPADGKVRLKFNSGGRYKVARDRLGNDPIVSEVTEFPAGQETRLYLVGETKSQARGGEQITMQINANGTLIDGDSLKATVVQTQFQIDLRVFIPYNWVNIPAHPNVAGGDTRGYDPELNGTYRVAQRAIVNLYKEWVPEVEDRLIDDGKWAGITYHHAVSNVTNFNSGANHSEDTTVKPSHINSGATPTNSGIADLSKVKSEVISRLSNDDQFSVRFEGEAAEPILPVAAPINWRFRVNISKVNPLDPSFLMEGKHDGYPAYEIYINSKHPIFPYTTVLQWKPPLSAHVWELVGEMDVNVGPTIGAVNQ